MREVRFFALLVSIGLLQVWSPIGAGGQVPTFDPTDARASFADMAEYLTRDGGRWRGTNPNHDGSENSPPEFGLWFVQQLDGLVLQLQIVVHYQDRTVVSSHGQWVWHPGTGDLRYIITDRGGGVTEGTTTFPDAATFVTIATRVGRNGRSAEHRDDNVLVSDSLHRNETFDWIDGRWVSGGVYEWRREYESPAPAAELIRLHGELLEAHRTAVVERWMAVEAEDLVSANGGRVTFPELSDRRSQRAAYLEGTTFEVYRDVREPVVRISTDGSLGWLIAEVEIRGSATSQTGGREPFHDIWAWIELYEHVGGRWYLTGNVSNRRPGDGAGDSD